MTDKQLFVVKIFRTWEQAAALRHSWDDLLADSPAATIFQTYEWIEAWWIAYGGSYDLFVIGIFSPDGRLMGIAPLYRATGSRHTKTRLPIKILRFLGTGTGGTSTSLGLIVRRDYEAEITGQLLTWLSASRSEWNVLDLHLMEAEPLSTRTLMDELKRRNWVQVEVQESHLSVSLPDKYETYLASLSKKMRTELPYENRRMLKSYRVDFRKVRSEDELQRALEALFKINTKRWQERGQSGSFGNTEKRIFCQEMAKRFLARGWLDFWLLDLDGRVAATEYGFRYNGIYYPLWVALDTEFQTYSAGSVLRTYIIQELIRDGIRVYEFMQGDEPYKLRWGTERRVYVSIYCAAPHSIGAMHMRLAELRARIGTRLQSIRRRCQNGLHAAMPIGLKNIARKTCKHLGLSR